MIAENEINVYVMPLGSLERRLDSTETTGGLPNFPSLPVKIYFFVMCTHVIHDDTLCTFFRDLRYFFSWFKMLTEQRCMIKQHHVALQREVVHVMHKTHAYRYGMHVVSQLVVDLSVRKGLL